MPEFRVGRWQETLARRLVAVRFGLRSRQRFYRDLAGLLKAGLSKGEALDLIGSIATGGGWRSSQALAQVLADVRNGMRNGLSLAHSLRGWVPDSDRMVIEAIESSDRFPQHLEAFSRTVRQRAGERGKIAGELAYPALLVCMVYSLLMFFHIRIAPVLGDLLPRSEWTGVARHLDAASGLAAANVIAVAILAAAMVPATMLALRNWAGRGRTFADRLPVFASYRVQTGIAFLKSMGALMSSGMSGVEAIGRIRPAAGPYVGRRLDLIRYNLLNGNDLGASVELAGAGWPDRDLARSLRVLAGVPDFPVRLTELADDWQQECHEELIRNLATVRALAFLVVFGVISSVVLTMYSIQGQIAASLI